MKKNNFKSLMQAAVLVCTPLVIASCDDVFGDVDNPIPSYMSIKEADVNLVLHKDSLDKATYTRTATAATGAEIVYSSSNEKVATVDAKTGKITAVGGGECKIIVEATGKDSHGNMTYQEAKDSFKVKVTDYRARIALKEGVKIPVYNSALATTTPAIKMEDIVNVCPKLGTTGLNVQFVKVENNKGKSDIDPKNIITAGAKVTLTGNVGVAKVIAKITGLPKAFEQTSFPKAQETDTVTIEVKEGVAYVSGYDEKDNPIISYMFKNYNGEKYTNLSDVLKGKTDDVALAAGWYCLDKTDGFAKNIRVKGDVNIILKNKANLTAVQAIMDESAKQSYKLNFYPDANYAASTVTPSQIQDFKEVNVLGVVVNAPVNKVENVTINKGTLGALSGTGVLTMTDANAGAVTGFETVTISKGTVGNLSKIGTATITDITTNSLMGIKTLTLNKVKAAADISNVTTLNINKECEIGKAKSEYDLTGIETVNVAGGKVCSNKIIANALIINDGEVVVNNTIIGFAKTGPVPGKVTINGGELTVGKALGTVTTDDDVIAVTGDVEVGAKGKFTAESNYHAVSGALTGTFYGSSDKKTWTKVDGDERPKYIYSYDPTPAP